MSRDKKTSYENFLHLLRGRYAAHTQRKTKGLGPHYRKKKKKKKKFERSVSLEMFCHSEGQNRTRSPECLMDHSSNIDGVRVHFITFNTSKSLKKSPKLLKKSS